LARAAATRYPLIVAVGGDGTVNEVANGLLEAGAQAVLGILPLGTGNDIARTFGLPLETAAAARVAADGHLRAVDLIRVGDRVVVNAIGVGLTGDINDRAASIKWVRGIAVYLLAAVSALFRYRMQTVRLLTDRHAYEGSMLILAVHGGPTTGGGFALTPAAVIDDGLVDACLVPEVGVGGRLLRLVAAMQGTLGGKAGTLELQAPWLELHFDRPLPAHLDGNSVTLKPPSVRFEVLPGALTVIVPAGSSTLQR
jgi:YegS/Rv2252/BmrU family lipid kinase